MLVLDDVHAISEPAVYRALEFLLERPVEVVVAPPGRVESLLKRHRGGELLLEQASDRLDQIMIPKVGTAADVYAVDMLVTQVENAIGRKKRLGFELIIETALGMANVEAIAQFGGRLEALHFGVADYAASMRARRPAARL